MGEATKLNCVIVDNMVSIVIRNMKHLNGHLKPAPLHVSNKTLLSTEGLYGARARRSTRAQGQHAKECIKSNNFDMSPLEIHSGRAGKAGVAS